MRSVCLAQLTLVALVAGVNFKFPYIVYKTARRDVSALTKYSKFLYSIRSYSQSDASVADIFKKEVVERNPDKVIFIFEGKEWKAAQIEEYSNKIANVFKHNGLQEGDKVALMMENRPEFVATWLGLSKIGVVTALINSSLRQDPLTHSVNIAECSAFIFEVQLLEAVKQIRDRLGASLKLFCWTGPEENFPAHESWATSLNTVLAQASAEIPKDARKGGYKDKLVYIYTSGTTGLPKPAIITNARYIFLAGAIRYQLGFNEDDRFYTPLPLYHTAGGAMAIGQALLYGSCVVMRKKFSAKAYFKDIANHNCTIAQYIGEICRYLLLSPEQPEEKKHNLRMVFGNGLRPQIWEEFVQRFNVPKVGEFYGATEGNANLVNTDSTVGAVGFVSQICSSIYPVSVIRVNQETGEPIRDKKGLCVRCKPNEPGLIIGKITRSNPSRDFLGYIDKKESDKKVVENVFAKGDSAFLSGDVVIFDEFGYIYFRDRLGDTFRWKGQNVSTSEVEATISNCIKLKDSVVYGVEVPGCEGRAGMAAILDEDGTCESLLGPLAECLRDHLPAYAIPLFIRCLNHIEMTGTFKMKKVDLQKGGFNHEIIAKMNPQKGGANRETVKENLQKEGSNHEITDEGIQEMSCIDQMIEDKLFYLSPKGVYEPLTPEVYKNIQDGNIRF